MVEIDDIPEKYWHCHVELVGDGKKKGRSAVFNDLAFVLAHYKSRNLFAFLHVARFPQPILIKYL